MFVDPTTGQFKKPGALIKPKKLCDTLYLIAHRNASELYNGSLGRTLVEDIRKRGGIITMKDLNEYRLVPTHPGAPKKFHSTKLTSFFVCVLQSQMGGTVVNEALRWNQTDNRRFARERTTAVFHFERFRRIPLHAKGLS